MKIFLVASTANSWQKTGYGASLMAGDCSTLLVSFVEFMNKPDQKLAVTGIDGDAYVPPSQRQKEPA